VQPETLRREVFTDDRHRQIRPTLASEALGQVVAEEARGVSPLPHLTQQRFPLGVRPSVAVPVGATVLAAMVEEADVVVLAFERLDLVFDELIELIEQLLNVGRNVEVHGPDSTSSAETTTPQRQAGASCVVVANFRWVAGFKRLGHRNQKACMV